jgi:curli biogenesis system outer membrane secretion channel CsgG
MNRLLKIIGRLSLVLTMSSGSLLMAAPQTTALVEFTYRGDESLKPEFTEFHTDLTTALEKSKRLRFVSPSEVNKAKASLKQDMADWDKEDAEAMAKTADADIVIFGSINQGGTDAQSGESCISIDVIAYTRERGEFVLEDTVEINEANHSQLASQTVSAVAEKIILGLYPITIAANDGGDIVLNYGKSYLSKGDVIDVMTEGEMVTDPATGIELGRKTMLLGKLEVTKTYRALSNARIISARSDIPVGAKCFIAETPKTRPPESRAVVAPASIAQSPTSIMTAVRQSNPLDYARANGMVNGQGKVKVAVGDFIYGQGVDLNTDTDHHGRVPVIKGNDGFLELGKVLFGDQFLLKAPSSRLGKSTQPGPLAYKSHVLRELISSRLTRTGQFDVLERSRLNEITREIELIESGVKGMFDKSKLSQVKLQGADYLVYGTITSMTAVRKNSTHLIHSQNTVNYEVKIEMRIVDMTTGQIVKSSAVSTSSYSTRREANLLGLIGSNSETGDGVSGLVENCAGALASEVVLTLRPVVVLDVDMETREILVNYGNSVLKPGDLFQIIEPKIFRDIYTAEIKSHSGQRIAIATVSSVQDGLSWLKIDDKKTDMARIQVGQICMPYTKSD